MNGLSGNIFANYLLSGLASSALQTGLMGIKYHLGILPEFRPYEAIQARLFENVGYLLPTGWVWTLSFINGTLLIGILFGLLYSRIPNRPFWIKGMIIGGSAWLIAMAIIFPVLGFGPFGIDAGTGLQPALIAAGMIGAYSLVYSFVYDQIAV